MQRCLFLVAVFTFSRRPLSLAEGAPRFFSFAIFADAKNNGGYKINSGGNRKIKRPKLFRPFPFCFCLFIFVGPQIIRRHCFSVSCAPLRPKASAVYFFFHF